MRKDLNKQLCERERHGSKYKFRTVRRHKKFYGSDPDLLPTREGMQKRYKVSGEWKELNENLNPLIGIIRKSVGKRWDDVFSEFCTVFNMNSVINHHILEHVFQYVEKNVFEVDGVLMHTTRSRGPEPITTWNGPLYYVHPATGILHRNDAVTGYKAYRRTIKERDDINALKERRVISEDMELRYRNGVWFVCELKDVPAPYMVEVSDVYHKEPIRREAGGSAFDLWDRATVNYGRYETKVQSFRFLGRRRREGRRYVYKVRTANRKMLKQYGIK